MGIARFASKLKLKTKEKHPIWHQAVLRHACTAKMASAKLANAGVVVLAIITHVAFVPEQAPEKQALSSLMEKEKAYPVMQAKGEAEEEEATTLLDSLRSLLSKGLEEDEENVQPAKLNPELTRDMRDTRSTRSARDMRSTRDTRSARMTRGSMIRGQRIGEQSRFLLAGA